MIYRVGDRSPDILRIKQLLADLGYNVGKINRRFDTQLEIAVTQYQADAGLNETGRINNATAKQLGFFEEEEETYEADSESRFNGLPGNPEVWLDSTTGEYYIVYEAPGFNPPIPLLFKVPTQKDLQSFFGEGKDITVDRTLSTEQMLSTGAIVWGTTNAIPDKEGDPWSDFLVYMERAMEVQPWLRDPEVYAIFAAAWLEGRAVQDWELQSTEWWQSHTAAERNWLMVNATDPAEAGRIAQDNLLTVADQIDNIGLEVPNEIAQWMADQWTMGHWSEAYLADQIIRLAGGNTVDNELKKLMSDNDYTIKRSELAENQIRDLWDEWLGPAFQPRDEQLARWADRWRKAPEATRDELINHLRKQRLARLPEYEDPNLTYQDIADTWRGTVQTAWGELPDETDPFFMKILRANDTMEAQHLLRKEGLKRNNNKVKSDLSDALVQATGGNVIRAAQR